MNADNLNKERFLILNSTKQFILSLEKIIITFPKKDIITRDMMYQDTLSLLELIYKANYETCDATKHQFQIEALAKVNKIDFYLERAYKLKYISEKQCSGKSQELIKLNKMLYNWCRNGK